MAPILLSKKERKKERKHQQSHREKVHIVCTVFHLCKNGWNIFVRKNISPYLAGRNSSGRKGQVLKWMHSGRSVSDGVCLFELSSVGKKSFVIKSLSGEEKELIDRHLNTAGVAKSLINCHLRRHLKMHSGEKSLACSFCCCSDDTKTQSYQSKYERNLAKNEIREKTMPSSQNEKK